MPCVEQLYGCREPRASRVAPRYGRITGKNVYLLEEFGGK